MADIKKLREQHYGTDPELDDLFDAHELTVLQHNLAVRASERGNIRLAEAEQRIEEAISAAVESGLGVHKIWELCAPMGEIMPNTFARKVAEQYQARLEALKEKINRKVEALEVAGV